MSATSFSKVRLCVLGGIQKFPDMEREVWMKKSRLATAAVAAVVVGTIGFSVPAFGASGYGAVNVTQNDSVVTIGNGALSRTFKHQR